MGNEMGNNNTTGLKEDERLTVEDSNGVSKETSTVVDLKGENHAVPGLENEDSGEKSNGLGDQTPSREEKEQIGDSPVVDLIAVVESNEEHDGSCENQQVLLPNDDGDESLIELNMDETVPGLSENQASVKKEEGAEDSDCGPLPISPPDLEPEKPEIPECDQPELDTFPTEPSLPDVDGSSGWTEQILGSISACESTENGELSEAMVSENLEPSVSIECNTIPKKEVEEVLVEQDEEAEEGKEQCEEKFEPDDEDESENVLSNASNGPSDFEGKEEEVVSATTGTSLIRDDPNDPSHFGGKDEQVFSTTTDTSLIRDDRNDLLDLGGENEEVFSTDTSLIRDDSSESESESEPESESISVTNSSNAHQQADESGEKVKEVTQQTSLIEVFENGQEKHDYVPNQACGDSGTESESRDSNAILSDSMAVEQEQVIKINPCTDFPSEEAKFSEDHEANPITNGPKLETVPSDSNFADCSVKEETNQSSEVEQSETVQSENQADQGNPVTSLIAEIIVSMNEQDIKQCLENPEPVSPQHAKVFPRESVERLSTDSDRDSLQYTQMRKSPSFSLDLRSEAVNEESEQTPLLYQDKAAIESSRSFDDRVTIENALTLNGHSVEEQASAMEEERVVRLERSDSEKSKTPFLELLREDSEKAGKSQKESSSIKVTISSTSSKGKEKRKLKSSLFGNCMSCVTMIN